MTEIALIIFALLLQAFFSGLETAFVSCNKIRIRYKMEKGNPKAGIVWSLLENRHRVLSTTLAGTNLCVVTGSILAAHLCGPAVATAIMVPVNLVFGEILPKSVSRISADKILFAAVHVLIFFQKLFLPVVVLTEGLSNIVLRIFGVRRTKKDPLITKENIELLVRQIASEGILERSEQGAIHQIFDFRYTRAGDVMVRLGDVAGIDYSDDKKAVIEKAKKAGFTRYPVLEDRKVKGLLNIFDIFYNDGDWHKYIRPVRSVYANQRINRLLYEMQRHKELMSAVVRKGRFIGIITLEDIIDEIELI